MKNMNRVVMVCALVFVVAAGSAFAGDGWQKLGSKTTVFKNNPEPVKIKKSDVPVGEIMFKVSGTTVEFTGVKMEFADGSSQETEFDQDVRPGMSSDPIAIDGGPKAISSLEFMYKVTPNKGTTGRSVVTVTGK
jgi:hypothetical protein